MKINVRKYREIMWALLPAYATIIFAATFLDLDPIVMKLAYTITFPFFIFGAMLDDTGKGKKA